MPHARFSPGPPQFDEVVIVLSEAIVKPSAEGPGGLDEVLDRGPTAALLRMVESMETKAHISAASNGMVRSMMRSRIGRPYLTSPICR